MSNPLSDLQDEVEAILAADTMWAAIPLFTEKMKDLGNALDRAVGEMSGIASVIISPVAVVPKSHRNQPGPYFDPISIVVRTCENPTLNKSGFRCLDVALQACALLHQKSPSSGIVETLSCEGFKLGNDPKYISYDSIFTVMGGIKISNPSLPVVADPVITSNGSGLITITQSTPHAFTWYTAPVASSTYPSPRLGTFYAGPFSPTLPALISARSWLPGYVTSKYIKTQINA